MKILTVLFIALTFLSCSKKVEDVKIENSSSNSPTVDSANIDLKTQKKSKEEILKELNDKILSSLKNKDYQKFATFIHPEKGVRFSMYAFINPKKDKVFSKDDFLIYSDKPTKFTWGEKDGSGDIFIESLSLYIQNWVYKKDFTTAEFLLNTSKAHGNSINNLSKIYPKAEFTENYLNGSEKYSFMDWNALRFVFEELNGQYYLIAVINDQWTI